LKANPNAEEKRRHIQREYFLGRRLSLRKKIGLKRIIIEG